MVKIAIQGHPTRGKEVIQILESLGGINKEGLTGTYNTFYYIDDKNEIGDDRKKNFPPTYKLYTLEEFEKEFPFKIGDKVIYSYTPNFIGTVVDINFDDHIPYRIDIEGKICTCATNSLKSYQKMKQKRNITLTLEKAKEWYKKGGELREVALQAYSEKELTKVELPKTWEEFCENNSTKIGMSYIDRDSTIQIVGCDLKGFMDINADKNLCPSKKSAEAHLAMMQLEQLRDCWRQSLESSENNNEYGIKYFGEELGVFYCATRAFLSFPTNKMAKDFLECFRDLIEKAGDLI